LFENLKKSPKGIDKIKIRFIIELWGKVGKRGKQWCKGEVNEARVVGLVENRGE
jgi:hypothetical protein